MRLFFLVFLLSLSFAADPVITEVMQYNDAQALALGSYYNASLARNSSLLINPEINLTVSAYLDIAGMNLMLDNLTHSEPNLSVILASGFTKDHLAPDDYDHDGCDESETDSGVIYDIGATLTFRNHSEFIPLDSNVILVPESLLEEMETASGSEKLDVSVEGEARFVYHFNDPEYPGCADKAVNQSVNISLSANRSFSVAGERKLFFLKSPVLREQWFRNNCFDVIVLSQSPLSYSEITLNGNPASNATLRTFYPEEDDFGLLHIVSNMSGESSWHEELSNGTPSNALSRNNLSYSFIYEFNFSYSGIGKNNLSLLIFDAFLDSGSFSETLLSRGISYNGAGLEHGVPSGSEDVRASPAFDKKSLVRVEVGIGLVAFIVLLAFVNFWFPR